MSKDIKNCKKVLPFTIFLQYSFDYPQHINPFPKQKRLPLSTPNSIVFFIFYFAQSISTLSSSISPSTTLSFPSTPPRPPPRIHHATPSPPSALCVFSGPTGSGKSTRAGARLCEGWGGIHGVLTHTVVR